MRSLDLITRVGPIIGGGKSETGPTTTIPFRIEFLMGDGPVLLSLSPSAAAELLAELAIYMKVHGFQ